MIHQATDPLKAQLRSYRLLKINLPQRTLGLSQPFLAGIKACRRFTGPKYPVWVVAEIHRIIYFLGCSVYPELN